MEPALHTGTSFSSASSQPTIFCASCGEEGWRQIAGYRDARWHKRLRDDLANRGVTVDAVLSDVRVNIGGRNALIAVGADDDKITGMKGKTDRLKERWTAEWDVPVDKIGSCEGNMSITRGQRVWPTAHRE